MKRYLSLVLVFVFAVMSVSGAELSDDYCCDSIVAVRFNTKYLRETSGLKYNGGDSLQEAAENITNKLLVDTNKKGYTPHPSALHHRPSPLQAIGKVF